MSLVSAVNTDEGVRLSWQNPTDLDLAHIAVSWSEDAEARTRTVPASSEETSIANLEADRSYEFVVRAVDDAGNLSAPRTVSIDRPFAMMWQLTFPDSGLFTYLIGHDDTLYVQHENQLSAWDANGIRKWSLPGRGSSWMAIAPSGTLYYLRVRDLVALSPTGTELWTYPLSDPDIHFEDRFAIGADDTVYLSTTKGLIAVDSDGSELWRFNPSDRPASCPAVGADGTIYVEIERAGVHLYAVAPDGTQKWQYSYPNAAHRSLRGPIVTRNYVWGAPWHANIVIPVYRIGHNGAGTRTYAKEPWTSSGMVAAGRNSETMYLQSGASGGPFRFRAHGNSSWALDARAEVYSPAVSGDEIIYFGNMLSDPQLMAVDAANGRTVWSTDSAGHVHEILVRSDGSLVVWAAENNNRNLSPTLTVYAGSGHGPHDLAWPMQDADAQRSRRAAY